MSFGCGLTTQSVKVRNLLRYVVLFAALASPNAALALENPPPKLEIEPDLLLQIRDDKPISLAAANGENQALALFLKHVRGLTVESLTSFAKPNLTVQQLLEANMARYRKVLFHVEGTLTSLRELSLGPELERQGIRTVFEGLIVEPSVNPVPTTVLFLELPAGLKLTSKLPATVAIDGFFFKRHTYADESKIERFAPVVVGRSMVLREPVTDAGPTEPVTPTPTRPTLESKAPDARMDCPREWLEHIEDDQRVMSRLENEDEYQTYNYFVLHARRFTADSMRTHTDKRLTFRRLFDDGRAEYRGAIAPVAGRLRRLTWIDSNDELRKDGVKDLYEAWVFDAAYNSNPVCVVFSELPKGITPGEDINGVWIECDAYFFKRYRYRAENSTRLAPLLIGKSFVVSKAPVSTERAAIASAYSKWFVPMVAVFVAVMVAAFLLMQRWFKRGDRWVRKRLEDAQSVNPFNENGLMEPEFPAKRFPDEPSLN